jgi:hypothetical protein
MTRENRWGAPRVHAEIKKLGYDVSEATVSRCMPKPEDGKRPQRWLTFVRNHIGEMASIDFFRFSTVFFKTLYGFVILSHERRRVIHFGAMEGRWWRCRGLAASTTGTCGRRPPDAAGARGPTGSPTRFRVVRRGTGRLRTPLDWAAWVLLWPVVALLWVAVLPFALILGA